MIRSVRSLALALALPSLAVTIGPIRPAFAAAGDLDPSFGSGGLVRASFGGDEDAAEAVVVQPDGKIVAVGRRAGTFGPSDFAVARFETDGSPDPTFGVDGVVVTDFASTWDDAHDLALQPDGRIVVAGEANGNVVLARYLTDGSLDPTFGMGGEVRFHHGIATTVALQPDGSIVVGGEWSVSPFRDFLLARFHQDGTVDESFGSKGGVRTDFNDGDDFVRAVAVLSDGTILAAGSGASAHAGGPEFTMARYLPNGKLDRAFGDRGKVRTDFQTYADIAYGVAIDASGRPVLAGMIGTGYDAFVDPTYDVGLARYRSNGGIDFSFDRDGRVNTDVSDNPYGADDDEARGIAIGTDGKITVAGYADMDGTGYDVLLARYLSTGALDTTFGTGGIVRTDVQVGLDQAFDLALQQDGKVVIAGTSAHGASSDAILARFLAA